jgi:hypothetical protein
VGGAETTERISGFITRITRNTIATNRTTKIPTTKK